MDQIETDATLPPLIRGACLLVVEDCRASAEAIRLLARDAGLRARHADSLAAARRHLMGFRPALILLDPGLPDGCGFDLLDDFGPDRAARPPVLVVSADPDMARRPETARADGFAEKPFAGAAGFRSALAALLPGPAPVPFPGRAPGAAAADMGLVQADLRGCAARLRRALAEEDRAALEFAGRFLTGLAGETGDVGLHLAADALLERIRGGHPGQSSAARLLTACDSRLDDARIRA